MAKTQSIKTFVRLNIKTLLFLAVTLSALSTACNNNSNSRVQHEGTTIITTTEMATDSFLTPCQLLILEMVRSTAYYKEHFGSEENILVGFANLSSMNQSKTNVCQIAISDSHWRDRDYLEFDTRTMRLIRFNDDKKVTIPYNDSYKKRMHGVCNDE